MERIPDGAQREKYIQREGSFGGRGWGRGDVRFRNGLAIGAVQLEKVLKCH